MGHNQKSKIVGTSSWQRVAGIYHRDMVRSSVIREELGVETLLLCVERSQLRWFRHLVRMPPGHLPREMFQEHLAGKKPRGRPRSGWRDYFSALAWERIGVPQSELADVAREREVWGPLLRLLPLDKHGWTDGWMDLFHTILDIQWLEFLV